VAGQTKPKLVFENEFATPRRPATVDKAGSLIAFTVCAWGGFFVGLVIGYLIGRA
jgi:hypothetical protein